MTNNQTRLTRRFSGYTILLILGVLLFGFEAKIEQYQQAPDTTIVSSKLPTEAGTLESSEVVVKSMSWGTGLAAVLLTFTAILAIEQSVTAPRREAQLKLHDPRQRSYLGIAAFRRPPPHNA
jgi:uncharacterized membrane protein